ncbi:hypothetical protein ACJJTC_006755 [Scirpophaga incertulas]
MYVVAEEEPDNAEDNGNVIVLSSMWLTPRKVECFWPNNKLSKQFNKILQKHHEPQEDWSLIKLKRKFFETDDLILARRKAKEAEFTSDLTDGEVRQKRKIRKPVSSSDEEDDPFHYHKTVQKSNKRELFENPEFINNNHPEIKTPEPAYTSSPLVPSHRTPQRMTTTCSSNTPVNHVLTGSSSQRSAVSSVENCVAGTTGFEYNTMKILNTILEQNDQILSWIRIQNELETLKTKKTPIQIPINFPIKEEDDVHQIEKFLEDDKNFANLCEYFTAFAGYTVTGTVNQILKHIMSNSVATKFNYRGKRGKKPFEALNLKTAIIRATKKMFKLQTDKEIEDNIKVWLKHAPQRTKLEQKKILARIDYSV